MCIRVYTYTHSFIHFVEMADLKRKRDNVTVETVCNHACDMLKCSFHEEPHLLGWRANAKAECDELIADLVTLSGLNEKVSSRECMAAAVREVGCLQVLLTPEKIAHCVLSLVETKACLDAEAALLKEQVATVVSALQRLAVLVERTPDKGSGVVLSLCDAIVKQLDRLPGDPISEDLVRRTPYYRAMVRRNHHTELYLTTPIVINMLMRGDESCSYEARLAAYGCVKGYMSQL